MKSIQINVNVSSDDLQELILNVISTIKENELIKTNPQQVNSNKNTTIELLTVADVAKKLKVNPNSVYSLIKNRHLQALKLGSLKVTSIELERFINYANGKDFTDIDNIKDLVYAD